MTPAFTGYVMQAVGLSAPFVLGGGLKIVYDVLLYATCRRTAKAVGEPIAGPSAWCGWSLPPGRRLC